MPLPIPLTTPPVTNMYLVKEIHLLSRDKNKRCPKSYGGICPLLFYTMDAYSSNQKLCEFCEIESLAHFCMT